MESPSRSPASVRLSPTLGPMVLTLAAESSPWWPSLLSGALAGGLALAGVTLTNRSNRARQETTEAKTAEREHEARSQERRAGAYIDALTEMRRLRGFGVMPIASAGEPLGLPLVSEQLLGLHDMKLRVYGTPEIVSCWTAHLTAWNEFYIHADMFKDMRDRDWPRDEVRTQNEVLLEARKRLHEAGVALEAQAASELGPLRVET